MRVLVVAMSLLGLLTVASPVPAEPHADAAAAQKLFESGRSAARRRDWQRACDDFAASQKLDPGAGTLLNWAMCEQALQKLASAWLHLHQAAQLLEPDDDRFPFIRAQLQKLSPRVRRGKPRRSIAGGSRHRRAFGDVRGPRNTPSLAGNP
jgi:hypothetical protein